MKKLLFTLLTFLAVNASAQLVYPTDVFWEFLSGYQAGDSTTDNYLKYYNNYLLLKTDKRDAKVLQIRNELNTVGISTLFIDANGNGGLSIDSAGGQTVIKLRGALNDHSYINNSHVSIGRAGQTQDYGGNVDGAKFTVSDEREPGYGLWDADNYQMMLQSSKDSIGGYVGLAFTSENATQDKNVGAFINYLKTGNNGKGELHFGTKTATGSLANGIHAMKIYDGSVTIDSTIVLPNLYTGSSDTSLVISNDTVYKKVDPIIETGTYTPTFSDFVEITSITNQNTRYNRIGNIVTVYCDFLFEATTANVTQTFKMTLPVASDLTSSADLTGTMTYALGTGTPPAHGVITGDATNDKADVIIRVSRTDQRRCFIIFTYEIK